MCPELIGPAKPVPRRAPLRRYLPGRCIALGNILSALLNHREQLDLLRADLERYVQQAVWEGLRWEPAVGMLPRVCPAAVTWHGIEIPASTPMIFAINAAHRDPAVYERPDEFDITRNVMPAVSFGQGPHSCVDDFAEVLVTEDPARVHRGPALVHVQVGSANVCGGDPDEHIGGFYDGRVRNVLDADLPGPFVNNSFHDLSQSQTGAARLAELTERPTPHC
jgi:hypothetical protein